MRVSGGCSTPELSFPTSYMTTAEAMWKGSSTVLLKRNIVCATRNNMITAAITAMVRLSAAERRPDSGLRSENSLGIITFSLAAAVHAARGPSALSKISFEVSILISANVQCKLNAKPNLGRGCYRLHHEQAPLKELRSNLAGMYSLT